MAGKKILGAALVFVAVITVLVAAAGYVFMDQILILGVDRFTDYKISYDSLSGNPFGKSEITGFNFEIKSKHVGFRAGKASIAMNAAESWRKKTLLVACRLENVELALSGKKKGGLVSPENILYIPFSPGHIYDSISFSAAAGADSLRITDFTAVSSDIRMGGYFTHVYSKDEVDIDIKVSFAPSFANALPGDIRDHVLSLDDDGWYGTDIAYKGNIIFLKALYSLAG